MRFWIVLFVLFFSSCHAGPSLEWVSAKHGAEVAHTALIFPEYREYVESDTTLTTEQKEDRFHLMDATLIRLEQDQVVLNGIAEDGK